MRKICVVTGSRAEFGLLSWLINDLRNAKGCQLQMIVTGSHLSPEFGKTVHEIVADGCAVDAKVEMLLSSDTSVGISKSIGLGLIGFAEAFDRLCPDIVVVLGDRYEIFAAAQAAMIARLPICHIHGGEVTEGAVDEAIRHAITKMAHLHFTSAKIHKERVIQLGEDPSRVFDFGAAALDGVYRLQLLSKVELEESLNFPLGERNLLVTFHPTTLEINASEEQFQQVLIALESFPDTHFLFTMANADMNGRVINDLIQGFVDKKPDRRRLFNSLGHLRYLSLLQFVNGVVGNSSSGLIEAPSFGVGTVNIGDRQKGRLRCESVIDCAANSTEVITAINKLTSRTFQETLASVVNPYGNSPPSEKMVETLISYPLDGILKKRFHDGS